MEWNYLVICTIHAYSVDELNIIDRNGMFVKCNLYHIKYIYDILREWKVWEVKRFFFNYQDFFIK